MNRRGFLALGMLAGVAGVAGCRGGQEVGAMTFGNPLRIPPLATSTKDRDGARRFALTMQRGRTEFLPGRATDTWGINGSYLSPTVRVRRGERVRMTVANQLGESSTLHWHGMRLPAAMDGGPHQMIEHGVDWRPEWTVDQPAATLWFHPHPHGRTAAHVYRGIAGLLLIDEVDGPQLPSRYGVDDIPLIVQDKKFNSDGSLDEDFGGTFGLLGDQILINGTLDPHLTVTTRRVRFRVLNASNARVFRLGFTDRRHLLAVATDAGLLRSPAPTELMKLSPGERAEFVVEFAPGEKVVLRSFGEDTKSANDIEEDDFDLLQVRAAAILQPSPEVPATLSATSPVAVSKGARVRRFRLSGSEINDRDMDMTRIDEVVPAGAREIWELENTTFAHNFHIHEVSYTVLDVNGSAPPPYQQGRKDTVFVPKKSTVRLAVEFGTYTDARMPYMYHCHILRHEDKGMMGQFVIVEPGTEGGVARHLAIGDGHAHHR